MTDVDITPRFGAELKDGFKPVNAWVANGVLWLDEIQQFYRERGAIEKEYSAKLFALAKKYFDRKSKKSSSLSVGDTPSWTPGSLESASLTTWSTQLTTLESRAAEHDRYSTELVLQVADPLKNIAARYEEIRKSHAEYALKLEKERDLSYGELKKTKGRYDGACQEVENRRKKIESSFDHGKQKAQGAYQQQLADMRNVKNTYIIGINVTNKQKERYYHEYVPDLLDSLQDLSETRVTQLNSLWSLAVKLETSTLIRSTDHLQHLISEIPRNEPRLDSLMFVRHNINSWQEPLDLAFEPSPVWLDDSAMVVDDAAKVFLRNFLGKSKGQLGEFKQDVDMKRREVEAIKRIRQNIRAGKDKRDEVELVRAMFSMQEDLHQSERKRLTAEVEAYTITSAVGDVSVGAQNHNFKSQTFKIPTNCDLCGDRIWGLSAKGFDCRDCGYTCHSKCEMKVPASCPGELSKDERKKVKTERQQAFNTPHLHVNGEPPNGVTELPAMSRSSTMNSLSSGYAASANRSVSGPPIRPPNEETSPETNEPRPVISKPNTLRKNRIVAPPPTQYISELPANERNERISSITTNPAEQRGKMLYAYQANGSGEISVNEGDDLNIVESDDGSGWVTIRTASATGLVPTSYVEVLPPSHDRPASAYSSSSNSLSPNNSTTTHSSFGGGGGGGPGTSSAGASSSHHHAAKKKGPAVAPKRGARKLHYVEAVYEYGARSEAEWSMSEGERFVLVSRDAGDGWADVEKGGVVRSVPANYLRDV